MKHVCHCCGSFLPSVAFLPKGFQWESFQTVTEKNKTTVEISATKSFIITTTSLLNDLHGHNITDKNKNTLTKNFIEATENFIEKLHRDIRTVQIAPSSPLPPIQYSRAISVHVSPEPLPNPQMQVATFPAVRQVYEGETILQWSKKIIRAVLSSALRKMTKGEIRS